MKLDKKNRRYTASTEKILQGFQIDSSMETIQKIANEGYSIARFGDGELGYINKIGLYFQDYNENIAKRLSEVLNSNEEKLLIGIPLAINSEFCENYIGYAKEYWTVWTRKNKFKILKLLKKNKKYGSAQISRFYLDYKDKTQVAEYVEVLKKIWENKELLIIEGEKSRLGVGNDLFDGAKKIERILCPAENAFDKYDEIVNEVKKQSKDKLILLALGPTATILSYDLHKCGYQTVDIGHVDIEYEWFLRKATTKVKIEGKYMGESGVMNQKEDSKEERLNVENVNDEKYNSQIISKIV